VKGIFFAAQYNEFEELQYDPGWKIYKVQSLRFTIYIRILKKE